ncbi:MAG: hypothetical protein JO033_20520 [Acidobacteriaceae bacterium]|nr:hypothetical protein [Acidobacteriaceae bacterium]
MPNIVEMPIEEISKVAAIVSSSAPSPVELQTGLAGAIGSDFRKSQNQLVFVEYSSGKLSALNLYSPSTIISSGSATLKGTFTFDLDTGVEGGTGGDTDIWWDQETAVKRQMVPQNNASILNLGVVDFASVTANNLEFLPFAKTPIPGNNDPSNKLVAGDVFAVRTTQGNFAKVKVTTYGYDLQIQWVTYKLASGYSVLGTGYTNPEDVKISRDNSHAYITERSGDLVRVSLANANRSAATVIASGMTAPQQIALDEAHNAAYVVEYAVTGNLWRIDLVSNTKTAILSNLNFAVGLALSPDLQYAYISEQTTGPDKGRVSRFRLSDGARQLVVNGLTAPFDLTWADDGYTSLFVTERDPANRVTRISLSTKTSQVVSGVAFRPSSVTLANQGLMLVCCDQMIEAINLSPFQAAGPLLMGIGFIPFDKVTAAGLADTTVDPSYFYQVKNTPFGGTLPILINYQRAANDAASYYRIKVDGVVRMDTWTDEKWNGTQYVSQTTAPVIVAGQPGYYPVHPISELFLWMNPTLGSLLNSTNLSTGLHTISIDFVNGTGTIVESSTPLTIYVDNNPCVAALQSPTLNGASADPNCGLLHYTGATAKPVTMAFTASQPEGFATYTFELIKGVNVLTPPTVSGPVVSASSPMSSAAATLLGTCTIAAFSEYLYVAATANNGWGRQSQYDASAAVAFVLAP